MEVYEPPPFNATVTVGSTVISGGVTNQLMYDNAGVLGEITKANSSVLVTDGAGVPSWSTTLPSGVTASSLTSLGTLSALGVTGTTTLTRDSSVAAALVFNDAQAGGKSWNFAPGAGTGVATNFGLTNATNSVLVANFSSTGALAVGTTLATAAPAGSSAGLWKLGALQTAAVVLDTTRSIYVDIGGTVYHLMVSQ